MQTITLNAKGAAAFLAGLSELLTKNIVAAETQNIGIAEGELVRASSGTHSTKELKAAGHPYAVRAPNPAYNPGIINAQTGAFRSGWQTELPIVSREGNDIVITSRVWSDDRKAKFMGGTDTMVKRPIVELTEKRIQPRREKRIAQSADRAFQKAGKL